MGASSAWWTAPVSMTAYAAIQALMWVAPRPDKSAPCPACGAHPRSAAFVAWCAGAYQASFLRDRLKSEGRACVYLPTCTDYAPRAVDKYGLVRGLALTGDRFRRCREGGAGSYIDFP